MHVVTMMSLVAAIGASAGHAWQRQWLPALAWVFLLAYTVFDKLLPGVLPQPLVDGFAALFLALILCACWQGWQGWRRRRAAVAPPH